MKSKLPTLLLSFIVAMGLWLYVVTTVSPEADQNYTGIPVVFENETSLLDRGLMLVSGENATVSVRLYGKRANLNRLTSSNIIVTADLKAVTEPGKYELEYKVSYPSGITNVSLDKRITPSVTVEAVEFAEKDVPVELVFQGEQQEGLILDQEEAMLSAETVHVSGAKNEVDQVTKAVKAIGYVGVGTLEFLLDRDGRFWFMEMNLRLQVEHGVTEMLTKIDLVKWQIRVAAGVPLNFRQQDVSLSGACLECRINATRPGTLTMLHVPGGPFVRFDTYLVAGTTVSPYYDSLLGKLIVYAGTREEALRKMKAALCELMALDFAIDELGLYLTTHPNDKQAQELYWGYIRLGREGRARYEEANGPLCKTAITEGGFRWLDDPWPWDKGGND